MFVFDESGLSVDNTDGASAAMRIELEDGTADDWLSDRGEVTARLIDGAGERVLAPPEDEVESLADVELWPVLPGASLDVSIGLRSAPLSGGPLVMKIVDGRCTDVWTGAPLDTEGILVDVTYSRWLAFRRRELNIIELLDKGGSVSGPTPQLLCLAGLAEAPGFDDHCRRLARPSDDLVRLADIWGARAVRDWRGPRT